MNDSAKCFIFPIEGMNNIPVYTPLDSTFFIKQEQNAEEITETIKKIGETLDNEWYGNLVNTLAVIVTLIIFIFQYKNDAKDRKRNTNENWYMNVIIQPNLSEINGYYDKLIDLFQNNISLLRENACHENSTLEKAKAVKNLKGVSKDFVDYFVTILQSYDIPLANKVDNLLNDMQDKISKWVDEYDSIEIDDCKREMFENKADLVNVLYSCITKSKTPWYKKLWLK